MPNQIHPAAPHHLPVFITAPGETDPFLVGSAIFLILMVFALGTLYFRLHALPEHLAHGNASRLQFEVVAVLALLALFTHNTWFWFAALLLALIPIPNFYAPLAVMARSLARMAGWSKEKARAAVSPAPDIKKKEDKPLTTPAPEVVHPLQAEPAEAAASPPHLQEEAPQPLEHAAQPSESKPAKPGKRAQAVSRQRA